MVGKIFVAMNSPSSLLHAESLKIRLVGELSTVIDQGQAVRVQRLDSGQGTDHANAEYCLPMQPVEETRRMGAVGQQQPFQIERIPDNLLREPVDYLFADHFRQRTLCNALKFLVDDGEGRQSHQMAEAVLSYLSEDFLWHIQDEEIDLYPALRRRCRQEDDIDGVLDGLARDHTADEHLARGIVQDLNRIIDDGASAKRPSFDRLATAFVATEDRHLILENDLILPLARRRLTTEDLERIGRAMAARRGIVFPL